MYQWCGFKSRRGKNKTLTALKSNSNTVWFNFQTYIYIYNTEEGHLLIENFVNIFFVTPLSVSLHNLLDFHIYIVDVVEWSRALEVRLSEWC